MTPKTRQLLSEHSIYVSWGIFIVVIGVAFMVGKTMSQVDQIFPVVQEVRSLSDRVTKIETETAWIDLEYNKRFEK